MNMGENHNHKKPHIIIIPPPFQGHINPSFQLSLKLASKGFTITFVNTQSTHDQITKARKHLKTKEKDIFAEAQGSGLDIRYLTISDGFPLTFDRSLNREQFLEGRLHVFPAHVDELVGQLVLAADPPPTCLIADTYSTWGSTVARKHGLVNISFWTQPALVLTLYYHLDLLKQNGHYGSHENRKDTINYIPGVRAVEPSDLMSYLQETDISNVMHRIIHKAFEDAKKADFIIYNTVQELEPEAISAIQERQPTYAIGPLFPARFTDRVVTMNLWSETDCTKWLDSKPQGSVLYVSFGSYAHTNKSEIWEIANGLLLTGFHFIWVLRPGILSSSIEDALPNRFQENVKNRGLILPWCNQNAVINHSAIGGFLTHCGWNSILESIWCRVPMICFPLLTDQPTNRKLVVDDWKIGINLCDGKSVSRSEVAEKIEFLMNEENSGVLKKAIEEIRKTLENASRPNGSSMINFDKFVEDVKSKIEKLKTRTAIGQLA